MKLISSPVKPSQLIFPSLTLIKSCNTSILVHTLSDIRCHSLILDLIDNLPSQCTSITATCVRNWVHTIHISMPSTNQHILTES